MAWKPLSPPAFVPRPVQLVTSRYAVSALPVVLRGTGGFIRGQNSREDTDPTVGSEVGYSH
jgi:hypothetical protein